MGLKVVLGRSIQKGSEVRCYFSLLSQVGLDHFLDIDDVVYEEAVELFYANLIFFKVPEGTDPILWSHLLETPIEFSLFALYEILDFPNECDQVFLSAHDKLPAFGKIGSDVFCLISVDGEKTTTATV